MLQIQSGGFTLLCRQLDSGGLEITGYTGGDSVLDLRQLHDVRMIGKKAFLGCKSLRRAYLPAGICPDGAAGGGGTAYGIPGQFSI